MYQSTTDILKVTEGGFGHIAGLMRGYFGSLEA